MGDLQICERNLVGFSQPRVEVTSQDSLPEISTLEIWVNNLLLGVTVRCADS